MSRFLSNTYSIGRDGNPDGVEDGTEGRTGPVGGNVSGSGTQNVTQQQQKLTEIDGVLKNQLLSLGLLDGGEKESTTVCSPLFHVVARDLEI